MPRYFTTISHLNMPKNKLQDDVQSLFKKNANRILNNDQERVKFCDMLFTQVNQLNEKHRRCKPVELSHDKQRTVNNNLYQVIFIPGGHFTITTENTRYGTQE